MARKKFDLSLLPPAPNLDFEQPLWDSGLKYLAGIDEAGRGALAGPVAAGVVILPNRPDLQDQLSGVRDSKQMTAHARQEWTDVIEGVALSCQVAFASPNEVDELGIIAATRLAVMRALEKLPHSPQHLLIDHISVPESGLPQTSLVKGDCRSLTIAAASVVAKVTRDRLMEEMGARYPGYCFEKNKGYGTAAHRSAIQTNGPCEIHRFTFAPIRQDETGEAA
jgi:ribonuclease HII